MIFQPGDRVALWGDSLGKGVVWNGARQRYGFAEDTAAGVAADALGIELINRSKFGLTAPQGLALMERDLEKGLAVDSAVVEFGGNDCNFDWAAISRAPDAQHDPATLPALYVQSMARMVELLQARGVRPILITLPPIHAERYFRFLVGDQLDASNVLRWLGDVQRIYRFQELYSGLAAELARKLGVELLDLRARCLAVPDFITRLVCEDGLHITRDGQRFAGGALAELARE